MWKQVMDVSDDIRLFKAKPGRWMTYHVGYLPRDKRNDPYVERLAQVLLSLSDEGKVSLAQQKIDTMKYRYLVQWRKK